MAPEVASADVTGGFRQAVLRVVSHAREGLEVAALIGFLRPAVPALCASPNASRSVCVGRERWERVEHDGLLFRIVTLAENHRVEAR